MDDLIDIRKKINRHFSHAREDGKLDHCYYCGKQKTSFCLSHSVPKFCLKPISSGKELLTLNAFLNLPFADFDEGASEAGTFKIICRECDSKIFREYENPNSYRSEPTDQMLAQIAMKNYLQLISKRNIEIASLMIAQAELGADPNSVIYQNQIKNLDLRDFENGFQRAKLGSVKDRGGWYYLCFYKKLSYQIPLAFQAAITMINDMSGNIINDIFYMEPAYQTAQIHLAAFPFQDESIILAFIDSRDSPRYRPFYKQLSRLSLIDQLTVINFLIFGYSENLFISKSIDQSIFENEELISVCKQGIFSSGSFDDQDKLSVAVQDYDWSKRSRIPNLLSKDYCLKSKA